MSKTKLSLTAKPTFVANVPIPIPGAPPVLVEMTFKGRTREQFREFVAGLVGKDDVQVVMDICSGWDLEDAFDAANVAVLTDNYMGAANAVVDVYFQQLTQARLKNS